jgi:hypothetical protein
MRRQVLIGIAVGAVVAIALATTLAITLRPKAGKTAPSPPPPPVPAVPLFVAAAAPIMVPQPTAVINWTAAVFAPAVQKPVIFAPYVPLVRPKPVAAVFEPVMPKPAPVRKPNPPPPVKKPKPPPPVKKPKPPPPVVPTEPGMTALGISPSMFSKGRAPWGTTKTKGAEKLSWPAAGQLKVTFPANRCASDGGILIYATPPGLLPARAATFSYRVYFASDYDFRSGGKLPGFKVGADSASGGNWSPGGASFRVMWRADGAATAYVYYAKPDAVDKNSVADQDAAYARIAVPTGTAGHSVWQEGKVADALPRFRRGAWNDISISIRLNSQGRADGVLAMSVNGVRKSFGSMKWLLGSADVTAIALDSWYGGSGSDCDKWAPKTPQVLLFGEFKLRRDG